MISAKKKITTNKTKNMNDKKYQIQIQIDTAAADLKFRSSELTPKEKLLLRQKIGVLTTKLNNM